MLLLLQYSYHATVLSNIFLFHEFIKYFYFSEFLRTKFLDHDNSPDRSKYHFKTTATDTNLVRNVIDSVQTIVINMILKDLGLMT